MPRLIPGSAPLLIIADHAANLVPPGIDLGIDPALLDTHIAVDIGTEALSEALAARLDAPALIATVSRLAIDLNRDPAVRDVIPGASDGHVIPGNLLLSATERELRIAAIHAPYHAAIAAQIRAGCPALIVSVHSFTPARATFPDEARPWPIGILYNLDDVAARIAMRALRFQGLNVGDNQPYSGRELNYTMDRHAEMAGIPYLGIEVRQDGLATPAAVAGWVDVLAPVIATTLAQVLGG
ncbi:MAG: N-formylglutamate amidohydrolase [Polymorphobacter sp.]